MSTDKMLLEMADVERIADLARIEITADEGAQYAGQLSRIFELVAQMQAVPTTHIEPMSHAQDLSLRLRDDAVAEADQRAAFQAIAPSVEAGLYLVPKVIE